LKIKTNTAIQFLHLLQKNNQNQAELLTVKLSYHYGTLQFRTDHDWTEAQCFHR